MDKCCSDRRFLEQCFPALKEGLAKRPPEVHLPNDVQAVTLSTEEGCRAAVTGILQSQGELVVGIDCEWTPPRLANSTEKAAGACAVSVVQVAFSKHVYVIHLAAIGGLPESLASLLSSHRIVKAGHSSKSDMTRLRKSYPQTMGPHPLTWMPNRLVDIRLQAMEVGATRRSSSSLQDVVKAVLHRWLPKPSDLQQSRWHQELSQAQVEYAALDAWVCLAVYSELAPHVEVSRQPIEALEIDQWVRLQHMPCSSHPSPR